jgi:hypothetical protein
MAGERKRKRSTSALPPDEVALTNPNTQQLPQRPLFALADEGREGEQDDQQRNQQLQHRRGGQLT